MGTVVMTPSNEESTDLVENLRETGATVRIQRISHGARGTMRATSPPVGEAVPVDENPIES